MPTEFANTDAMPQLWVAGGDRALSSGRQEPPGSESFRHQIRIHTLRLSSGVAFCIQAFRLESLEVDFFRELFAPRIIFS
jgi:hypothetical protein